MQNYKYGNLDEIVLFPSEICNWLQLTFADYN